MNIGQTIYIALLAVVAIASFTSGKSITNVPNGNQICFPNSRPYSGLPWPLTDARDIGQIIGHGAHCVSTVQGYAANPPSTPMDVMHQDHCLCFLHRMLDFWTANPSYAIPAPLCDDIRRPYINAQQQELPQLWDFYIYDPRFNNNGSSSVADLMNTFNGLAKQAVGDAAPQDLFGLISGQHLGDILLRDYENGRASLSVAEQEWIGHWEADQATRMSALGVVCVGTNEHASHNGGHHGGGNVKPVIANGLYYPPVETLRTIVSQTRFNKVGSCSKWGH